MRAFGLISICGLLLACQEPETPIEIYETSAAGNQMKLLETSKSNPETTNDELRIKIDTDKEFQTITGFGGSFTEASAYLLSELSAAKRKELLEAYFGSSGSRYSLTRTHINSCDFALGQYAYANVPGDTLLQHFDISHDEKYLIPMMKQAMDLSEDGFHIISSPWTAPPWMKDNNSWVGGQLLPEYRKTWALYFAKYIREYEKRGIPIWGITVENEPLGNGNNWESMHFSAQEMTDFVQFHLGPVLAQEGLDRIKILGYDQNRDELKHWVDVMYKDSATARYLDGTAIHWYASTYKVFEEELDYANTKAPDKHLIQTEACVDAEVPAWKNDDWYWNKNATDWGFEWAPEELKHLHPRYIPAYRYARDIIGCLNHGVDGWVDWNMVLNRQGGPNWFENWCVAPVIVDTSEDEIYYTPLFYVMQHFSKFIRPGARRLSAKSSDQVLLVTAAKNVDESLVVIVFNPTDQRKRIGLTTDDLEWHFTIDAKALQTVLIGNKGSSSKSNQKSKL
ncbi:MAG TPA: glycoside hydrolase family 30 protein [Saprospiraceae bacterium]|nr:glycoside hydrolase family 30 protein [Saprospiraceae bacterium]